MTKTPPEAQSLLKNRIDYDALLATFPVKDRARLEKQVAAYETAGESSRAALFKRLMCALSTLAPHRTKINAPASIQFYEQDGKYRRQVFALEDGGNGALTVYCEDVVDRAVAAGMLAPDPNLGEEGKLYRIVSSAATLMIERIDGSVINPQEFFKHMVGWNRKALRITLPVDAGKDQIMMTEALCAMSIVASAKPAA